MNAFACLRTSTIPPEPRTFLSENRASASTLFPAPVQNCRPSYPAPQFPTNSHLFPAIPANSRLFSARKNSNSLIGNHLLPSDSLYKKFPWNFPVYTCVNTLCFGHPNLNPAPHLSRMLSGFAFISVNSWFQQNVNSGPGHCSLPNSLGLAGLEHWSFSPLSLQKNNSHLASRSLCALSVFAVNVPVSSHQNSRKMAVIPPFPPNPTSTSQQNVDSFGSHPNLNPAASFAFISVNSRFHQHVNSGPAHYSLPNSLDLAGLEHWSFSPLSLQKNNSRLASRCLCALSVFVVNVPFSSHQNSRKVAVIPPFPLNPTSTSQQILIATQTKQLVNFGFELTMRQLSKRFRPFVIILLTVLLVGFGIYSLENWQGDRAWNEYLARAKARGEKASSKDYLPPAVPDEQNFAKIELFEHDGYKGKGDGKLSRIFPTSATITWNQLGSFRNLKWTRLDIPNATNVFEAHQEAAAEKVLASYQGTGAEMMEELRTAARERAYSRFDTDGTFDGPMPNFVLLRTVCQVFSWHALASLLKGDAETAVSDMRVIHKVADGLQQHPTLVESMIRTAITGVDKQVFYEGWARRLWHPEHYRYFLAYYSNVQLLEGLEVSIHAGEKHGVRDLIESHSSRELVESLPTVNEYQEPLKALVVKGSLRAMPRGWWRKNLLRHHEILDKFGDAWSVEKHRVYPEKCAAVSESIETDIKAAWPHGYLAAMAIPNFGKAARTVARAQAEGDQAAIVCALELFHLEHGSYPDRLAELAPEFMASIPKDIVSGETPSYRKTSAGFELYSWGWNGKDHGGTLPTDGTDGFEKGDFVWPFAEKPRPNAQFNVDKSGQP
jgi:hypothetical protein